jgi:hypothetical protein
MATANIKITALSDITSANMTFNDLVAVVDMNGVPETKKATVQLVGNLILNEAGGSYFPAAAQAVLAQSVTNAAQPNIISVGTLTSLVVTSNVSAGNLSVSGTVNGILVGEGGNISNVQVGNVAGLGNIATINLDGNVSNVLRGDGTFAADAEGTYGDGNVVSLLGSFGSNTISTTGLITGNGSGLSAITGANVTGEVAFAATANAVAGANVSGEVDHAAVANSVALANVSGAGNIASINLDGNVSNVLRGDGTFSADAISAYGDGNVVSLMASFGSNTISTTGLITGDGGGISNVPYGNVTGTPTLGNVSAINLDGNVANVLRGDGTFAADSEGTYGDSNVVSLLGAFGSNTISTTGNVSVGTLSGSNGAAFVSTSTNQFVVERDNGTSFRFKGNNISGNTIQTYAGIFYNGAYGNTPETQTRLIIGSNEDASLELQTSNEMRISAVDNNTGGGKVRIASGDGNGSPHAIEFHPGTQAEVNNLVAKIDVNGLEVTSNVTANNGVFTNVSGNGSALASLTGANVTGEVAFAATANAVAGANVSGAVSSATTAGTVTSNAQSNITSVGTLTSLAVTGNASAGNISTIGTLSVTGNADVGNINADVGIFTGNVSGGNFQTNGSISAIGNIAAVGNVSGGNLLASGLIQATGNVVGGNISTAGQLEVIGNANVGNVGAGSGVFSSNVSAGNISTIGTLSVTGNANIGNIDSGVGVFTGALSAGNITGVLVQQSSNVIQFGQNAMSQANSIAIGTNANATNFGAVAIGRVAGNINPGQNLTAIGDAAGFANTAFGAVYIGAFAGGDSGHVSGTTSIAIGYKAAQATLNDNCIVLSANGGASVLNTDGNGRFYVDTVRNNGTGNVLQYNTTSKEISYSSNIAITTATFTPVLLSVLGVASTAGAGTRAFISDGNLAAAGNFGAVVSGGGSNNVPVFSNGTDWLIG